MIRQLEQVVGALPMLLALLLLHLQQKTIGNISINQPERIFKCFNDDHFFPQPFGYDYSNFDCLVAPAVNLSGQSSLLESTYV